MLIWKEIVLEIGSEVECFAYGKGKIVSRQNTQYGILYKVEYRIGIRYQFERELK